MKNIQIDGGILAGGLSTRMNGQDKGLQQYKGQALAHWVLESLNPFVHSVHINCNQNQTHYQGLCPSTCSDTVKGFQGPLAGLVSLMEASTADYLLISPCDTPKLGQVFGDKMLNVLHSQLEQNPDKKILIAARDQNRCHPLHLCISRSYKSDIELSLKNGNRRVMQWVKTNQVVWVDFSEYTSCFENFNRLADLEKQ